MHYIARQHKHMPQTLTYVTWRYCV